MIKRIIKSPLILAYKLLFQMVGALPRKQNLIIFESFLGKQYSDNPRAIYEYLKEHHPEYQMVWSVDPRFEKGFSEKGIPIARRFSVKWLFLMARARFWITNSRMPIWIPKPRRTIYLQTWHGTPLKKLAHDMKEVLMPGTTTEEYKKEFYQESRNWDYLLSPNKYSTKIFKRAFKFDKNIVESGYPRNDILYDIDMDKKAQVIKNRYNLPQGKKVILYAPTWRDNQYHEIGRYKFNLHLDLNYLRKKLGEDYIIILRLHYLVAENIELASYDGFAYDFSHYEDISELYLISDLLITDYSSVFFDYANLQRPMVFFVYDIDEYKDEIRGFYFDFEREAPGPLVKTTEEVLSAIKEVEKNGYNPDVYKSFYDKFCYLEDGYASERVVKSVILGK